MKKLVILDYSNDSVHFYNVASNVDIDEEYISNLGFHPSNCHWMFNKSIDIFYHKGILK